MVRGRVLWAAAIAAQMLFGWTLLSGLGAPLLWYDEADTAMFGQRVLEYGYPKVHGEKNVVYGVEHPTALAVEPVLDAYLGSPWGQYYFAAPAVAWSQRSDDLAERTRRVLLPFALAGWLGVVLLGGVGSSLVPGGARGRALFWLGYGCLLLGSVSLQLHLREARYYPLVVLAIGVLAWLEARAARGTLAPGPRALWIAGTMFALFHLFYPAFALVGLAAVSAHVVWALRGPAAARERVRRTARGLAPYALAALAAAPMLVFYRVPAQLRAFYEVYEADAGGWWMRLGDAAHYLLRYEWLAAALVGAALLASARARVRPRDADSAPALAVCVGGVAFALLWWLLVARTPLFFERYYVALSPILSALCALALACLVALAQGRARRLALGGAAALAVLVAYGTVQRLPELRGRVHELREPYRGPLDHLVPYLIQRHPDPSKLVIATNYEAGSLMFYLGATAICDYYAPDPERDRGLRADVIVPRPWRRNLDCLAALADGRFAQQALEVANLRVNNLPELSLRNAAGLRHRFHSPPRDEGLGPLLVLERVPGAVGGGALVRPPGGG